MNTPTKLTVARILMTIVMIFMLLFPFYDVGINMPSFLVGGVYVKLEYLIAGVIFVVASVTDFLENSALIILASKGFILTLIPVVIIFRDTVVDAMKMEAARKGKVVAAISSGKIKTASMMVGVTLTFFYNLPFEMINIRVSDFFLYFATIMSVVSMCEYYKLNKNLILPAKEKA